MEKDFDLLALAEALDVRRHDHEPVGADDRRHDAGAAEHRLGDEVAVPGGEAHAHPVLAAGQ